ncbi:hypothetical protein [Shewanella benthica]|uniref:Uncharacterized protein n=1 Tax=Shewanella benthica KT99 TaxID=314608 RepID=A9DCL3_9GAMM|nr:hypothetical protein [Shewanella benthica]EDQ00370.1 hypothetical protein KT99_09259 [Shewanella benthica KT99]
MNAILSKVVELSAFSAYKTIKDKLSKEEESIIIKTESDLEHLKGFLTDLPNKTRESILKNIDDLEALEGNLAINIHKNIKGDKRPDELLLIADTKNLIFKTA